MLPSLSEIDEGGRSMPFQKAHMRSVDLWSGHQIHWRGDIGMELAVQQTDFASLYLLSEILRENSDVRQPSTYKP